MIVYESRVANAPKADLDLLDVAVSGAIEELGGPPDGLMVHVVRPEGDGFVIIEVWRDEDTMRRFNDAVLVPRLAEQGLVITGEQTSAVWSFARP